MSEESADWRALCPSATPVDSEKPYKHKISCIYLLVSPSGKLYVGQTGNLYNRWRSYLAYGGKPRKAGTIIGNALRKYGFSSFSAFIIDACSPAVLDERERFWISALRSLAPVGYNSESGGCAMKRHSAASLEQMSRVKRGPLNSMHGGTHTAEARAKISAAHKGRKVGFLACYRSKLLGQRAKGPAHREALRQAHLAHRAFDYEVTAPDGLVSFVVDLAGYCLEHGLTYDRLASTARAPGASRQHTHKGYHARRSPRSGPRVLGAISLHG